MHPVTFHQRMSMTQQKKPVALVYTNANGTKTTQNVREFARRRKLPKPFAFERHLHKQHKDDLDTIMAGGTVPNCQAVFA